MEKRSWILILLAFFAGIFQIVISSGNQILSHTIMIGVLLVVGLTGITATEYSTLMVRIQRYFARA